MSRDLTLALRINGNRAIADMRRFTDSSVRGLSDISRRAQKLRQDFNGVSTAAKLLMGAGGILAGRQLLSGMIELEKAMLGVKSNLVGGAKSAADLQKQLSEVRDTARQISGMTIFSDAEMVGLTNQLLKSGINADFVNGKDGAAMSTAALAQLGGLTPEQAASAIGALGNAFSFNTKKQYMGLGDHIVKADDASAMNSGGILYNMQQTAATAASLKIDPKKIVTLIAYLDALGNEAGTSVNRMLGNLSPGTKKKRKAMAATGMDFWEEKGHGVVVLKEMNVILEIMRKTFSSMKNTPKKMELEKQIFGEEGERAVQLLSSKTQTFSQFEKKVEGSTGAIAKLEIQMDGLGAAFERLKNTTFSKADTQFGSTRDGIKTGTNVLTKQIDKGGLPGMLGLGAGVVGAGLLLRYNKNRKARLLSEASNNAESLGKAAQAAKVQSVFVTNWPKSMLSAGEQVRSRVSNNNNTPDTDSNQPARSGKLAKAGNALGAAGAALSGWEIGQAMGGVVKEMIDTTLQTVTKNQNETLGSWLYDKLNTPIKVEPIKIDVNVQNGNITAAVNKENSQQARRN